MPRLSNRVKRLEAIFGKTRTEPRELSRNCQFSKNLFAKILETIRPESRDEFAAAWGRLPFNPDETALSRAFDLADNVVLLPSISARVDLKVAVCSLLEEWLHSLANEVRAREAAGQGVRGRLPTDEEVAEFRSDMRELVLGILDIKVLDTRRRWERGEIDHEEFEKLRKSLADQASRIRALDAGSQTADGCRMGSKCALVNVMVRRVQVLPCHPAPRPAPLAQPVSDVRVWA